MVLKISALLLSSVLALVACDGSGPASAPTETTETTVAAVQAAPGTSTTTTAAPATTAAPDEPATVTALPLCNVFPASVGRVFQGNAIKVQRQRKAGDVWTESELCTGLLAASQASWAIEQTLFAASGPAAAFARGEAGAGETVPDWGTQAWWTESGCAATVRYANFVLVVRLLTARPNCRPEVEHLARAYTAHHLE